VWIGSGFYFIEWLGKRWDVMVYAGGLSASWITGGRPNTDPWFRFDGDAPFEFNATPFIWYHNWDCWMVGLPLWVLAAASLLATGIAWRLDTLARRPARLNLCPKCNYHRTGLENDAVCPECGSAAAHP
jgi:hypothetical protein